MSMTPFFRLIFFGVKKRFVEKKLFGVKKAFWREKAILRTILA